MIFCQHLLVNNKNIREINCVVLAQKIKEVFNQIKAELAIAQDIQVEQVNKYRQEGQVFKIENKL